MRPVNDVMMCSDLQGHEDDETIRMFCAYMRRTLLHERVDLGRKKTNDAKFQTPFSSVSKKELHAILSTIQPPQTSRILSALGWQVDVLDMDLADAMENLDEQALAIIMLYYFAEWSDARIGATINLPRSTVQYQRTLALKDLRNILTEGQVEA